MEDYKAGGLKGLFTLRNSPFVVLFALLILLPVFFVPSTLISFEFSKSVLLTFGVIVALSFFLASSLKSGTLALPRGLLFFSLLLVVLSYLVSSFLSSVPRVSFVGYGFEVTTFTTILLCAVLLFLSSIFFQSSKKLFASYTALLIVSSLLAIFHIARLFFGVNFLSFGYFPNIISNTFGKWNELSILFGATGILSLMALEMLRLRPRFHIALWASFVLSIIMVIIVNLPLLWYVLGGFSLGLFVYLFAFDSARRSTLNVVDSENQQTTMKTRGRTISVKSIVVAIIAVLFLFTPLGTIIGGKITERALIDNIEVRPSWEATFDIAKIVLKADPLFGAGPNRFGTQWQLYRPDVNQTNFWNLKFGNGISFIPTSIIETGIFGLLAWLLFFAVFIFSGFRVVFGKAGDRFSNFFAVSSFFVALYLWIMNFIYMPTLPLFALTFIFTGFSIAASANATGISKFYSFLIFKNKRFSSISIFAVTLVFIGALWLGYIMIEKTVSSYYYAKGASLAQNVSNVQGLDVIENYMLRAAEISPSDVYYKFIASINVSRLNNLIASASNTKEISEEMKNEFQRALATGVEASRRAQSWDKENYENWLAVASVYESVVPAGVEGAADSARAAYEQALRLSPRNPAIYLALGRFEAAQNNLPKAKENVNKALVLKNNYLEAIFFLSQVDVAQGNISSAARSIEQLAVSFPNDPNIFFRLGLLKYELKDYKGAATAFEKAISSVPVYANARYFLGLTYQKLNRINDAIVQFEEVNKTNPENAEVKSILSNLRAGKDPFAAASTGKTTDNKPEKRKTLPVEENEAGL